LKELSIPEDLWKEYFNMYSEEINLEITNQNKRREQSRRFKFIESLAGKDEKAYRKKALEAYLWKIEESKLNAKAVLKAMITKRGEGADDIPTMIKNQKRILENKMYLKFGLKDYKLEILKEIFALDKELIIQTKLAEYEKEWG
jgi:hypothetical protein